MRRPLRILVISQYVYPDSFGGVERVAHETTRRLAARGHDVHIVGQRTREGTPDTEQMFGLTLHRYGDHGSSLRFAGRTMGALRYSRGVMAKLVEELEFDVVLPHHYFPYYAYIKMTRHKPAPEVMTFHASFWQELKLEGAERSLGKPVETLFFGGLARRTERVCLSRADRVVVLSEFSREQLSNYYPFATAKVRRIPGGVDLERFRPAADRGQVRASLGLPPDRPILFTARRLVPRMGVGNLLAALSALRTDTHNFLLVVAGGGRLERQLRAQASSLGLDGRVRFAGFVGDDELVRYYQSADLFVLPSLAFEGFGMVTLEALACGTPALGTPIGATPEILTALAPQLVLGGTEPTAIARGIRSMLEWLSDEAEARSLRAQCRAYVEAHYGWDPSVDALEEVMDELVSGGGPNG
jgi:glycosyltransferase involved in cell wall biosynthesis